MLVIPVFSDSLIKIHEECSKLAESKEKIKQCFETLQKNKPQSKNLYPDKLSHSIEKCAMAQNHPKREAL